MFAFVMVNLIFAEKRTFHSVWRVRFTIIFNAIITSNFKIQSNTRIYSPAIEHNATSFATVAASRPDNYELSFALHSWVKFLRYVSLAATR